MIQREIAMRTVAVFAHRLYGAITSAHFMAATVPFAKPATIVSNSGFFGPSMASLPIFGAQRPPSESSRARRWLRTLRNIGVFGVNLVGLSAGSPATPMPMSPTSIAWSVSPSITSLPTTTAGC